MDEDTSIYTMISLEECNKYKDWFSQYGYEALPCNAFMMYNHDEGITMKVAYTNDRNSIKWEGCIHNEFVCQWAEADTPQELVVAIKAAAYTRMVDMRNRLDSAIYLIQR